MDIPANLISLVVIWVSFVVMGLLFLAVIVTAPWVKLKEIDNRHVYFGAIVLLMVLWSLAAGISPGQSFHLIGATTLYLMFGWQFALLAISVVVVGTTLNGAGGWETLAVNILLMGLLPVTLTSALLYLAQRYLSHNYYIYIFVNAFMAAALASIMVGCSSYLLLTAVGAYSAEVLRQEYLPFALLLVFPEAFVNGFVMSGLVVYKPEWVSTFDDGWYLYGQK